MLDHGFKEKYAFCITGQWEKLPLWTLERELVVQDIAEKESIKVLEKATVPIVKMTDKYSDVKASTPV